MNSTLASKKSDYEEEVGEFMGRGRGTGTANNPVWDDDEAYKIRFDVKSGLKRFYYCGHPWSFLKTFLEVAVTVGETVVTLPDEFGGVDQGAKCLVIDPDGHALLETTFIGPSQVEAAIIGNSGSTGVPRKIAQRPIKQMAPGKMQRSELVIFPTPDQAYTLKFSHFFTADYLLDVTQPFAYGGVEHHETILECCLAVAEMRRDNMRGVHNDEAQRLLIVSQQLDRRKQEKSLGYNGDRSDNSWGDPLNTRGWTPGGGVTINGTLYT